MSIFQDLVRRVTDYIGDKTLMLAAVSAASNVIVADSEVDEGEVENALVAMRANPIIEKGYDTLMLEAELFDGIGRARTRVGRADNLRRVAAIAERSIEQRNGVFLIAADAADHEGISDVEHRALVEIAAALAVDREALLRLVPVKPSSRSAMLDNDKLGFVSPLVLHKIGHDLQDALPPGSPEELPANVEEQAARIPDVHGEPRIQLVAKTGVEHLKDEPLF